MAMTDLLEKLGSGGEADNEMIDLAEREGVIDSGEAMLMRQMLKVEDEKSFNSSLPNPASSNLSSKVFLVIGFPHSSLSSFSLLNRLGKAPKRLCKNSSAEIGVPSALQKEVAIVCCISRSLPSFNLTFTFFIQTQGLWPHL